MTLGSIMPLILVPIFLKKVQSKMNKAVSKNSALSSVLSAAAFIGLISAFVARAIAGKGDAHIIGDGAGILSITALISSVILMLIMQKLAGLEKLNGLKALQCRLQ